MKSATEFSDGMTDAGRACRNTIRFSGTPESLALSMNSQFMASMNPARNSRLRWATCPIMTVTAGMIETLSSSHTEASANTKINAGNSGIQTAKKMIRRVGEFLVEQKLPDYNSGYRGFQREYLSAMLHLMPNGFSFSTTSTLAFIKEGYNIATTGIEVTERAGRKSNVRFFRDGTKAMMLVFRIIMLFNPLKVFLPSSIGIFLIGFVYGLLGYIYFSRFSNGAMVLTTLGMFLFFIGLLADQISIMNRKKS